MKEQEHDVSRHPYPEVNAMIAQTFEDVFSPQWVETHLIDPTHDLVILCHIIPWRARRIDGDQLRPAQSRNFFITFP